MLKATVTQKLRINVKVSIPDKRAFERMIKELQAIGGHFSKKTKLWTIPSNAESIEFLLDKKAVLSDLDLLRIDQIIEDLERVEAGRTIRRAISNALEAEPVPHLQSLCNVPIRPFQWVPLHYALQTRGRLLLADTMGLGKSLETILITLHENFSDHPVLIVCPAGLRENWQEELRKMFNLPSYILTDKLTRLIPGIRYYICSYQCMKKQTDLNWLYVFDEAHNLKNKDSQQTLRAKELTKNADHIILVTGTPESNRPAELFPLLSILDKSISWTTFANDFCELKWTQYGWKATGAKNTTELNDLLIENYMVRRIKSQVASQLPPKQYQTIHLDSVSIQADSVLQLFSQNAEVKAQNKKFLDWLADVLHDCEKVLIFAHHQVLLDAIEELCRTGGWEFIRIQGDTPSAQRSQLVYLFEHEKRVKVALLSIKAAGVGLNMPAASTVIHAEGHWDPGVEEQAEDRAHRLTQTKTVHILRPLVTKFDADLLKMINKKVEVTAQVVDGKKVEKLSAQDVKRKLAALYKVSA